jgi:hypothetical protein
LSGAIKKPFWFNNRNGILLLQTFYCYCCNNNTIVATCQEANENILIFLVLGPLGKICHNQQV